MQTFGFLVEGDNHRFGGIFDDTEFARRFLETESTLLAFKTFHDALVIERNIWVLQVIQPPENASMAGMEIGASAWLRSTMRVTSADCLRNEGVRLINSDFGSKTNISLIPRFISRLTRPAA